MPELPEVEAIRLGLKRHIVGRKIKSIEVKQNKIVTSHSNIRANSIQKASEFVNNIEGKTIIDITRRAKNLFIILKDNSVIAIHLKMTGQLIYKDRNNEISGGHPIRTSDLPNKHTAIIFELDRGVLYYNDIRKFGYVLYFNGLNEAYDKLAVNDYGKEPLNDDFDFNYVKEKFKNNNRKLKTVFLNQDIVVGLGNIYADEVAYASSIRPDRVVNNINDNEIKSLIKNIKTILNKSISLGGSSISDYLLADGSRGNYAREHKVYGRAGKNCFKCNNKLSKLIINTRTTILCDQCQK